MRQPPWGTGARGLTGAVEAGRRARDTAPRSSHASWQAAADRADPVEVLERQALGRVAELLPLRYERMLHSPSTFFRGAAAVMAADLASTPTTGLRVQLCGDAHLANFGGFAAPDRQLVFDLNDFDETLPGPWEWDVKRLAASIAITGRDLGLRERERRASTLAAVTAYRLAIRRLAAMRTLDVWYARLNVEDHFARWGESAGAPRRKALEKTLAKARPKDSLRAFAKLTHEVDGARRIVSDPPLVVPLEDLLEGEEGRRFEEELPGVYRAYRRTLQGDRRSLLDAYRPVHVARKVVGVGSVGTRDWIVLLLGRDDSDPLFLQVKEAQASVLEPFAGPSKLTTHGRRVVEGQRLMQGASDVFLGWTRMKAGLDGRPHDYYVRQLWDSKATANIEEMTPKELTAYAKTCGWTLARAHARSGNRAAIAAYLGRGDRFDTALADFAEAYADQNERDYEALQSAGREGRVRANAENRTGRS